MGGGIGPVSNLEHRRKQYPKFEPRAFSQFGTPTLILGSKRGNVIYDVQWIFLQIFNRDSRHLSKTRAFPPTKRQIGFQTNWKL